MNHLIDDLESGLGESDLIIVVSKFGSLGHSTVKIYRKVTDFIKIFFDLLIVLGFNLGVNLRLGHGAGRLSIKSSGPSDILFDILCRIDQILSFSSQSQIGNTFDVISN